MLRKRTARVLSTRQEELNQVVRMRRYLIAAGSSMLVIGLLYACARLGVLPEPAFFQSASMILLCCVVFYLLFRSGLNRRFSDPSLTGQQMFCAIAVTLYAMYLADGGRAVLLVVLMMIFLFGVLQLSMRALLMYALGILAAYGGVIALLWRFKPHSMNLRTELLQLLALTIALPWFAVMGGYIGRLRVKQKRLNRTLRMLSDCNITLVRAENERDLLADLCRLVVESGSYLMAWAGVAEQDDAKTVRPVAQAGNGKDYLDGMRISWDAEQDIGCGPTGTAIRTGITQLNRNYLTEPRVAPWRDAALKQGYRASGAFPLVIDNQVLGALSLYAAEPESFGLEEVRLLEELARNVAFGIAALRARAKLERYQHELEERVAQRTQEIAALNTELVARATDAEAANRAKSAFLSTMTHEIRTPLNAVVGLTGLLADSSLNRRQRDYADKLKLSAQALHVLVDDILDFSKIEAGALRLEHVPFSLDAILRTTAAIISAGMNGKPIEVLFDVAHDMPDTLIGDAVRLQQILLNLASNAVKFTERGDIVVSVRCLARKIGEVTLQLTVRDTGIGIPPHQLDQIFDVFTQADTSTTRQYGGTGLGLAISARLAQLMGGTIHVDSAAGRGSEFRFVVTLPEADCPVLAPPHIPAGLCVLVIDDHPLARAILQRTCAAFGWDVTAVDSGLAGLDELRRSLAAGRDYDLMLLDWRMPGMDGIEMLRQAYDTPDIGLPQVILMASIFELEQAAAASDDLYLDGIVAKPVTPGSLLDVVKRAHAGDFTAILPVRAKPDRRLAHLRLLVAEDNAINQQVIEQVLTSAGATVVIAANGLAAVNALRSPDAHFDAVLMDIQMPVMDGYCATQIIRNELGLVTLPIIAVTAHALPEDREKSRLAGMTGHLVKPIDVDDLHDMVSRGLLAPYQPEGVHLRPGQEAIPASALPLVDLTSALNIFGGDRQVYSELLCQLVAAHRDDVATARRCVEDGDATHAAEILHDLRGIASLLMTPRLAALAAMAESVLRCGETDPAPALLDELQMTMEALEAFIDQFAAIEADARSGGESTAAGA